MDIDSYINLSKNLMSEGLPESIVCTIIQETGKDRRTTIMENNKDNSKPTEKQINMLKKFKIPNINELSREEASSIISKKLQTHSKGE